MLAVRTGQFQTCFCLRLNSTSLLQVYHCSNVLDLADEGPVVVDADYPLPTHVESQPTTIDPPKIEHLSLSTHQQCTLPGRPIEFFKFKKLNRWRRLMSALGEYDFYKQCCPDLHVPKRFTEEDLATLSNVETKALRRKFLNMLATAERQRLLANTPRNTLLCEQLIHKYILKNREEPDADKASVQTHYGDKFWSTHRIFSTAKAVNLLLCPIGYAPRVVVDMSWHMQQASVDRARTFCYVLRLAMDNFYQKEPFQIHLTSFRQQYWNDIRSENLSDKVEKHYEYFLQYTESSFSELFAPEEIVYLSPQGEVELEHIDAGKVYVLGGISDVYTRGLWTVSKAAEQGLVSARLPLQKSLNFECKRSVDLPLYCVFAYISSLYFHDDVNLALRACFDASGRYKTLSDRLVPTDALE